MIPAPHASAVETLGLSYSRRIFVNRTIELDDVDAIGFDMDYTLCRYRPELEGLATELAIQHLVKRGYPDALLQIRFDPAWGIRGLVIDTAKGNVVKMDAHRHVTRAWHGLTPIGDGERRAMYASDPPRLSAGRWAMMDTLFSTPESFLYCHIVDLIEGHAGHPMEAAETRRLYADIRYCIDMVHRDDSLKSAVRNDLAKYIDVDPHLAQALHRLRSAGKKLFVLTNSDMSYTEHVMTYLLDGALSGYRTWQDYFDAIWVTACKPRFFEVAQEPFRLGEKSFDQGSREYLERDLGVSGDKILYVGDHIYGDVLKSRSTTGWRTALIMPEVEGELAALESEAEAMSLRSALEEERFDLEGALASAELSLRAARRAERKSLVDDDEGLLDPGYADDGLLAAEVADPSLADASSAELLSERETLRAWVLELRERLKHNTAESVRFTKQIDRHFNPRWGQLLNERHKHSLFGNQMKSYACLYTSRVSNLAAYSPRHKFEPPRDLLPHERMLRFVGQ